MKAPIGEPILITALPRKLRDQFDNGASGPFREDSVFRKNHNIELLKEGGGNKNTHIIYWGPQEDNGHRQTIRKDIQKKLSKLRCVFTGTTARIEVDHKDGRKDDARVMNTATQVEEDYQPTCKTLNDIKRQVCKPCRATGQRFDATAIGFSVSVVDGSLEYEDTCKGCYYHDPVYFRSRLTVIR
tara:strand:+ start:1781 stop:2335 length:555 start_codon:yes stop_codon:yes gene_type:complete